MAIVYLCNCRGFNVMGESFPIKHIATTGDGTPVAPLVTSVVLATSGGGADQPEICIKRKVHTFPFTTYFFSAPFQHPLYHKSHD